MSRLTEILQELKPLMGSDIPQERERIKQLNEELTSLHLTEEEKEYAQKWWNEGVDETLKSTNELRQRINEEVYKLIPMSYIAKKYFGKSAAWLYQRINGIPVRGKVYTLSEADRETFNRAIQEVAQLIGSVTI